MRLEEGEGRATASAEATERPATEPDGRDLLVREQAAAIAHYKKMYAVPRRSRGSCSGI
jgi:hypothetical protein